MNDMLAITAEIIPSKANPILISMATIILFVPFGVVQKNFSSDEVPDHDDTRCDNFCNIVFEQLRCSKRPWANVCKEPNCQVVDSKTNNGKH